MSQTREPTLALTQHLPQPRCTPPATSGQMESTAARRHRRWQKVPKQKGPRRKTSQSVKFRSLVGSVSLWVAIPRSKSDTVRLERAVRLSKILLPTRSCMYASHTYEQVSPELCHKRTDIIFFSSTRTIQHRIVRLRSPARGRADSSLAGGCSGTASQCSTHCGPPIPSLLQTWDVVMTDKKWQQTKEAARGGQSEGAVHNPQQGGSTGEEGSVQV